MSETQAHNLLVLNTGFTVAVDGPGQRMVVYLKGCNMCCPWCAAPESMAHRPEVLFYSGRADEPVRLSEACPMGAVRVGPDGVRRDTLVCASCDDFPCLKSNSRAFELAGGLMSVQAIVDKAARYRSFYSKLGGVTIGGGEPACQFDGVAELLAGLREQSIHTAVETNGSEPRLPELFPLIDLLFIDLKHPDDDQAARITGQGNRVTLDNIRHRYEQKGAMVVRICLVPGYNADDKTVRAFGEVLSSIGRLNIELLPFHRRGEVKWRALGREMPAADAAEPTNEHLQFARKMLSIYGLNVS
ncbi:MAG: glycyl-radical enzyme activating protein [Armatimonadota bacterium]|nr:glycyl-radical enzyme activating protein [Armatimonadota bacterium]